MSAADTFRVRIAFGHLDYMPRCVVTRRAVEFCSHCLNHPAASETREAA